MRNKLFVAVCALLILGGGYWLWSRGVTNLPVYAMLLLCPLMHLFMHGGHDHKGHGQGKGDASSQGRNEGNASCH